MLDISLIVILCCCPWTGPQ